MDASESNTTGLKDQVLRILFRKTEAFLASDRPLTFDRLGMPEIAKVFRDPAYWMVRVLNHIPSEGRIFCEVISYEVGDMGFDRNQQSLHTLLREVGQVTFRSIDTRGLLQTLAGNTKTVSSPIPVMREEAGPFGKPIQPSLFQGDAKTPSPQTKKPASLPIRRLSEEFTVPFKEVRFRLGGVAFQRKFKGHGESIELTIHNPEIREEFDAVRNYFANALGTKRVRVSAHIEIQGGRVLSVNASSPDIDRIDRGLIDNVKFEFVKATTKKRVEAEVDRSLFTMDEYLDRFGEEGLKPNAFHASERELFEDILSVSGTMHYRQLRLLSDRHAHDVMKLRFVHRPFSFIFLLKGERHYHIVWETLDTREATYLWHVDKDIAELKRALRKVEDIINVVKVQGKKAYIDSNEDAFRRIYHDYSNLVDGFVRWKGELESVLT